MKKYLLLFILLLMPLSIYAKEAKKISLNSSYYVNNEEVITLNDNSYDSYETINKGNTLTIKAKEDIKYIYIIYEYKSSKGTLTTSDEKISLGTNGFLHEYQKINVPVKELAIKYDADVIISEIQLYTDGNIPDDVQIWTKEKETDLMLFSTHADDEVLFFAGIMPTYINQGKKIHVVYMARHDMGKHVNPIRLHEQLDGLWTLGITDYPTFGIVPDQYSRIKENTPKEKEKILDITKKQLEKYYMTEQDIINFDIKVMREYKPKVVVGHDEYGEYGHGQHILNTYTLKKAIDKVNTKDYKLSKAYLHLYDPDNWTVLDLDLPLNEYGGKTAYQMSKKAFLKHVSQQFSRYPSWLNGENNEYNTAKDITEYNPMYWGLYYTSVGPDVNKNDLFENIPQEEKEVKEKEEEQTIEEEKEEPKDDNLVLYLSIIGTAIVILSILYICIKR